MQALRERHGFTQEQLAALLGLRRESLSRIESGKVALTLPILQRFTRVMTLARGVREHLAWAESRGNLPDERHLDTLAVALHLDKASADEVVLVSTMAYDRKRRETLRALPGGLRRAL
ncbi:MAG TPA: helix-turn-helix transcriptional regulator [Candidatus Thermoplasmatota archaeon]|nr:helix-turn-helix transcriptional regulator [Candidatus Thermoplasmatota archaeon]